MEPSENIEAWVAGLACFTSEKTEDTEASFTSGASLAGYGGTTLNRREA